MCRQVGHGIDLISGFSKSPEYIKLLSDEQAVFGTLNKRMERYLDKNDYQIYNKLTVKEKKRFLNGETFGTIYKHIGLEQREVKYLHSPKEIVAEGYGQFSTVPEFKNYAKSFNQYYNNMESENKNKTPQIFNENKEPILRSYELCELEEIFMKKYRIKRLEDIDEKKMCEFLIEMGYD